jgi:hypothetical protein
MINNELNELIQMFPPNRYFYRSTEVVSKNLVSEIIPSWTFAALPFWELSWPVK